MLQIHERDLKALVQGTHCGQLNTYCTHTHADQNERQELCAHIRLLSMEIKNLWIVNHSCGLSVIYSSA